MHDRQSADFSFENQLQKLLQTGLGTIQAGADVRDDLVAALLAEMFGLPDEIGLLIMTGYTRIADVETLLRFSTRQSGRENLRCPPGVRTDFGIIPRASQRRTVLGETP